MRSNLSPVFRVLATTALAAMSILALAVLYGPLGAPPADSSRLPAPVDYPSVRIIVTEDGRSRVIRDGAEVTEPAEKTRLLERARLLVIEEQADGETPGVVHLPAGLDDSIPAIPRQASMEGSAEGDAACCSPNGGAQAPGRL